MNIKPKKLTIKNIGKIASMVIEIDKPLILFYGEIKQGKTTILNAVRWVCGGTFPADIIKHGEKEGSIELELEGGLIARSFYRSKDGETKSRAVTFVRNGKPVPSPVNEIKRLLNPFLLDQDFLRNKTELERKQYFTELFAVDTTALDSELFANQRQATELRAKIGGYGEIDLTPTEAVDLTELQGKRRRMMNGYSAEKAELEAALASISEQYEKDCKAVDESNELARTHNNAVDRALNAQADIRAAIAVHEKKLAELKAQLAALEIPPKLELKPRPEMPDRSAIQKKILEIVPDTVAIDKQIQDAGAANVRAEQYQKNLDRSKARHNDESALALLEKRGRDIKAEKLEKLQSIGESSGIAGLSFDESGNFIYDSTTAGMISDSQIMRLSSELSALYPDGFGLDLIDRGESLGKSIFEFVDRAKAENKTILATIVGEKPAMVPENIGVFVVENGTLKEGQLL